MDIVKLVMELPANIRRLAYSLVIAYQTGDVENPDRLIELAAMLEQRGEDGQRFVESFLGKAVIYGSAEGTCEGNCLLPEYRGVEGLAQVGRTIPGAC